MHDFMDETLRLYSRTDDGLAFVWIYGFEDGEIHLDTGVVGHMATRKTVPLSAKPNIETAIGQFKDVGFSEIVEDDMAFMEIVFDVEGNFASAAEFEKRNELLEALDEFLALTGQGWVDGASSGDGTMEVSFLAADPNISKSAISAWVKDTQWSDFKSIEVLEFD